MRRFTLLLVVAAALSPSISQAGWLADVEVYDRTAHQTLPLYEYEGRLYIAGEPRHQYELRVRNRSEGRVLAVTSVDGVNVISGKTAAEQQGGYVAGAWDVVTIDGWRKSLDEVAVFYFTRLRDSYAARTGRPNNVGVIGVALFREHAPCCTHYLDKDRSEQAIPAPSAGAPAASRERASADAQRKSESRLGTGHGHRESSAAQYVDFRRASSTPDETIVIYYDSQRNLVAQGVIPSHPWYAQRRADPFPEGFTPDP